jgi:hypothetical protein
MARNQVKTLWTVIVTAFLALCAALGLVTTTATAAVPQTEPARNGNSDADRAGGPAPAIPAQASWSRSRPGALPPTMKQRIHAEAHGKSPRCRRTLAATDTFPSPVDPAACETSTATEPTVPLQR